MPTDANNDDQATRVERLAFRALLTGAACGAVWGAVLAYVLVPEYIVPDAVLTMGSEVVAGSSCVGAVFAVIAALGFRFITRRR